MSTIFQRQIKNSVKRLLTFLLFTFHFSLLTSWAQDEITIHVEPVQRVLPPHAGQYVDNPGKFFTVTLTNNTSETQRLHIGMQIDQLFPSHELWVSMEYGHIPNSPIEVGPNQTKRLNAIEMKYLFAHYTLDEVFIKDGDYANYRTGNYGLMPEGQYEVFLTAYKWDPNLTGPVLLSDPKQGNTIFNICYSAQSPRFTTPNVDATADGFDLLYVHKISKDNPSFAWTQPTLNCNPSLVTFEYNVRIVELGSMMPDEAVEYNVATVFERNRMATNTLRLDNAYVLKMLGDEAESPIYAMQVTAAPTNQLPNSLNYTLVENDGKSQVLLFQLYDPNKVEEEKDDDDGYSLSLDGGDADLENGTLYTFEQPTLTQPSFSGMMGRKIYQGEGLKVEWRKAWFAGGKGEEQEKVDFEYTLGLYKGNSADTKEVIFQSTPILEKKTTELKEEIKWDDIKDKVSLGDYFILRVTAKPTNEESVTMLGDKDNYIDFALTEHFDETYKCGTSTADIENKTLIEKVPEKGTKLKIGEWKLELNSDVKLEDGVLKGTGWISWSPGQYRARIAVKFDDLKVNTDNVVFDGSCKTYPKSDEKIVVDGKTEEYTTEEAVEKLFSASGLDDVFGNLPLPEGVQEKISNFAEDKANNLAASYNLGSYYTKYRKAREMWNNWETGNIMDLYFPVEMPDDIKKFLPKDFSLQIANISFTPSSAVANLIGEVALPNSDVFKDQDVLIFGAPRLCIQPDKLFPEDGVLALLSNFAINDPTSDFKFVFKAPKDPLNPRLHDGCFLSWENDKFEALGLQIAMTIPGTNRIVDGKVLEDTPAMADLWTEIHAGETAGDFIAEGTLTAFEVKDLPGWTFGPDVEGGQNELHIVVDHNLERNSSEGDGGAMPTIQQIKNKYPTFDASLCGTYVAEDEESWKTWQGVYINSIAVGFPKFAVFGNGDKGLTIGARDMIIDASGISCQVFANDIIDAQTGKCGGWKFEVSSATVDIIQNNFDNCRITGGFGVPLLGKVAQNKAADETEKKHSEVKAEKSSNGQETDVQFTCEIRHLVSPTEVEYYLWNKEGTDKIKKTRKQYAENRLTYLFRTENIDDSDLALNFVLGTLTLDGAQNYFLVEAVDSVINGKQDVLTQVEFCMAGDITLAGADNINDKLSGVNKRLNQLSALLGKQKLNLRLPGIHFAKMRLSNVREEEWDESFGLGLELDEKHLHANRLNAEKKWTEETSIMKGIYRGKEIQLDDNKEKEGNHCYFNFGEWSLASERKKIGPFSYNISKFTPGMSGDKLGLTIAGKLGLVGDKIEVEAEVEIGAQLHREGSITDWYISDGSFDLHELKLGLDFTMLHLDGTLKLGENEQNDHGYKGNLTIEVTGLFKVACDGGYFNHHASADEQDEMKTKSGQEAQYAYDRDVKKNGTAKHTLEYYKKQYLDTDTVFSYGYFLATLESGAGIRLDPLVINRISGGFYFNCKPTVNKEKKDMSGPPVRQYGTIGIAFGLGMSSSAGEQTLKADVDLLVVYDRKNNCLSTFQFQGTCEAVGGIIKADVKLLYQNEKDGGSQTMNRYLCLNVTVESGWSGSELNGAVTELNKSLESIKNELDDFQNQVDGVVQKVSKDPVGGLKQLTGKYEKDGNYEEPADDDTGADESAEEKDENKMTAEEKEEEDKKNKGKDKLGTVGKSTLTLELKITWVEEYEENTPVKWHLYLGEPAKEKRCKFTFIEFESKICSVNIGADAYLCIGNELPNNGQLPEIPSEITEFLTGHKQAGTDMGADMGKVNNARQKAVRSMLSQGSVNGGVMVGASAWGNIDINLGLIYGYMHALAGFDASLINYGGSAICMNTHSRMGKNGWYAMGQIYALLEAEIGLHIKLGSLINEHVKLLYAGIGGVLSMGLPNPTWMEGTLKAKMSFLGGLFKLNKSFSFSAGDKCVPFRGNALDGFEMFQSVNVGSDSLYQALCDPAYAVSLNEAKRMTFTTNTSIGSHYRLVDPSYSAEIAEHTGADEDKLSLHAGRTYVFDMQSDQSQAVDGTKMGVRLIDLGETGYSGLNWTPEQLVLSITNTGQHRLVRKKDALGNSWSEWEWVHKEKLGLTDYKGELWKGDMLYEQLDHMTEYYESFLRFAALHCSDRESTTAETSIVMTNKDRNKSKEDHVLRQTNVVSYIDYILDNNKFTDCKEVNVSYRESQGTVFHLSDMNLEPGHSYCLVLSGEAFEIDNGRRVWCEYVDESDEKNPNKRIKWRQSKLWYFHVKSEKEDAIVGDSIRDLEPYVALAYPSVNGTKTVSGSEGYTPAYINDIMHPTIALNRDVSAELPEDEGFVWKLTAYKASEYEHAADTIGAEEVWHETQTRKAVYNRKGNSVNLEPASAFSKIKKFSREISAAGYSYDYANELYHLQLLRTYSHQSKNAEPKDSTYALVDLWLTGMPHGVEVKGMDGYQDDSWMQTTNRAVGAEVLPYSQPFVGASPKKEPVISYENDMREQSDEAIVYENEKYDGTPYRLIDPYLYLAYLSQYTFVGDRALKSYAFDSAEIPFGTESLIYDRYHTVWNTERIYDETQKLLVDSRDDWYSTWNDWNYNDKTVPEYPLPVTTNTVSGPTVGNQYFRASTVTPLNLFNFDNNLYSFTDLTAEFMAPYILANKVSEELYVQATDLFNIFCHCRELQEDGSYKFNDELFNDYMFTYNKLHRGQYLEMSHRGATVKIPYYQLPLIFGGCFSGDPKYLGASLKEDKRSWKSSLESKKGNDSRWSGEASNLLFFRLLGRTLSENRHWDFAEEVYNRVSAFSRFTNKYANSYASATSNIIDRDKFDLRKSLENVTQFEAYRYRVDSYNLQTGLYEVHYYGGGPWIDEVKIGEGGLVANMGEMYDFNAQGEEILETHYDSPITQCIWTESDKTMTLVFSNEKYPIGGTFNGKTITNVWRNEGFMNPKIARNQDERNMATKVVVDPSMADASIRSMQGWFSGFRKLKTITGLSYLNTSDVRDMSEMFWACQSLTSLDLSMLNTQSVEDMSMMFQFCTELQKLTHKFRTSQVRSMRLMFSSCGKLSSLDLSSFNTRRVEDMGNMFQYCESLTSLDLTSFNTSNVRTMNAMFLSCPKLSSLNLSSFDTRKVEDMSLMFMGCTGLVSLDLSSFSAENLENASMMFRSCNNLKSIDLPFGKSKIKDTQLMFFGCLKLETINMPRFSGLNVKNSTEMFRGCTNLKTLHIDNFSPENVEQCENMFNAVPNTLNAYVAYDLCEEIYVQIPGTRNTANHPNKVILAQNSNGENELIFVKADDLNIGSVYDIEGKEDVYEGMKIVKVWDFESVQNTKNSIPWESYKESLVRVTVDLSFKPDSKTLLYNTQFSLVDNIVSLKNWFAGCKNLVEVNGLNNLYTTSVEDMSYMFADCESLRSLDFSKYDTYNDADMRGMFKGCKSLEEVKIKLGGSDLTEMFAGCSALTSIEFTSASVGGVTSMSRMFYGCESLKELDFGDFVTGFRYGSDISSNLKSTQSMFEGCSNLENINFRRYGWGSSDFITSKVTDMSRMFASCPKLKKLDLSVLYTQSVTNMQEMFDGCSDLQSLDMAGWDTQSVKTMTKMFNGCTSLQDLNMSTFSTASMSQCSNMFSGVPYECTIYIPYDISTQIHPNQVKKPTYPNLMIIYPAQVIRYKDGDGESLVFLSSETKYAKEAKTGYQTTWNGHEITAVWSGMEVINRSSNSAWTMSYYTTKYKSVTIDPSFANIYPLTTKYWFSHIDAPSIDGLQYLNTSKVTDMSDMFASCNIQEKLDLSTFDTSNVTDMSSMFQGCKNMEKLDLSTFDTSNVTDMAYMFTNCTDLTELNLSSFNTSKVNNFFAMFAGCSEMTIKLGDQFIVQSATNELGMNNNAMEFGSLYKAKDLIFVAPEDKVDQYRKEFTEKLGFVEGTHGIFFEEGKVHPQVIWTEDNQTLTFTMDAVTEGDTFNGQTVTKVWNNDDVTNTPVVNNRVPWTETVQGKVKTVAFNLAFSMVRPKSTAYWFADYIEEDEDDRDGSQLTTIRGLQYLNTSEVTTMAGMFLNCWQLTTMGTPKFNTEKVTDMHDMFSVVQRLEKLDLTSFNTSNVTNMEGMFAASTFKQLNLSSFNTAQVTNADRMFFNFSSEILTVGTSFRFGSLSATAANAFRYVKGLDIILYAPGSGTLKTFAEKSNTEDAIVGKLGFVKGTNGRILYGEVKVAQAIWTAGNTTLTFLYANQYKVGDTYNGQTVTAIWSGEMVTNPGVEDGANAPWTFTVKTGKVTAVDIKASFAEVKPTVLYAWFSGCSNLITIRNLRNLNTSAATNMAKMFAGCAALTSLDVSKFNTEKVTTMESMFEGCTKLASLDIKSFNTANVTNMKQMFYNDTAIKKLTFGENFNTAKVTTYSNISTGFKDAQGILPGTKSKEIRTEIKRVGFTGITAYGTWYSNK